MAGKRVIFEVDGRSFNVRVKKLKRHGVVTDGKNSGRLDVSLDMDREVLGTFYNYDLELDAETAAPEEYDELYWLLTAPNVEFHTVKLPFAQDYLTFQAYCTTVDDELELMADRMNKWVGTTVQFIAKRPQREAV